MIITSRKSKCFSVGKELQTNLIKLYKWLTNSDVDKPKLMQLRKKKILKPSLMVHNAEHQTGSYSSGKKSRLCVDRCLKPLAQYAVADEKANEILRTIMKLLIMRQNSSFCLSPKGVVHPHLEHCVLFWLPHLKRDILKLVKVQ